MKRIYKIILLLASSLILLSSISEVKAQTIRKRFNTDLVFGFNLATMDIEGANQYKEFKVGAVIGANFNYKIWDNIQIQTGLYITKKGLRQHVERYEYNPGAEVQYYEDSLRNTAADYLQIPLAIGYEFYVNKSLAFNINAGGYVAYGFKGKNRGEAYSITISPTGGTKYSTVQDPYEEDTFKLLGWNRYDYGLLARAGVIYDIFTFNVTYEYGLHNVADDGRILKNRNISLALGFRF